MPLRLQDEMPKRIGVFDTETTGVDVETARIVTAFIGLMDTATGEIVERWSWLLDPGVEIPEGAAAVHGITTERARAEGSDASRGVFDIMQRLDILERAYIPMVVMNAAYDYTVLDRELRRHWPGFRITAPKMVIDPMVLDRAFDKYRPGSRKLVDLAKFYRVPVETNAHDAEADCRMAGRVAIKLMGHSRLQPLTLEQIHLKQIPTKRTQALELAAYWRDKKLPTLHTQEERAKLLVSIRDVETSGIYWPVRPFPGGEDG
jgi:DNA polymerase-3 subunit epsilon